MMTGLYIHVPFCARKCPYCDFYSCSYTKIAADAYVKAVCRNLDALPSGLDVDTVYFGGGTPSLLPTDDIAEILDTAAKRVHLCEPEITLEANPRTMTWDRLSAWRQAGVNRLSVGVQSFSDELLTQLGRNHSARQGREAVELAAEVGFSNLSLDLMIGLEKQDAAVTEMELLHALELPIKHISVYLLKIEDGTPFSVKSPNLLDDDAMAERYMQIHETLTAAGFRHYEISNYAQSGFESRHNSKYWRCEPYYGIGPAAHSCFDGKRFAVPRDLTLFCQSAVQPKDITDDAPCGNAERIMLGTRLAEGICLSDYPSVRDMLLHNASSLMPKYLYCNDGWLRMTATGWLVSNAVLVKLLDGIL